MLKYIEDHVYIQQTWLVFSSLSKIKSLKFISETSNNFVEIDELYNDNFLDQLVSTIIALMIDHIDSEAPIMTVLQSMEPSMASLVQQVFCLFSKRRIS